MKLILASGHGFVGQEVLTQALSNPAITSIISLGRRETSLPPNLPASADTTKLRSVVCDDFLNYSDDVKREIEGADACIWLIAITPSKLATLPFPEVRKISLDYTIYGLKTMAQLRHTQLRNPKSSTTPFRFVYVSGIAAERDQTKTPPVMPEYCLMRGETESLILSHAAASVEGPTKIQASISKPGLISSPDRRELVIQRAALYGVPIVEVAAVAATLLKQVVDGIEMETLLNEDLVRIGGVVLEG